VNERAGHNLGTAMPQSPEPQGRRRRQQDTQSCAPLPFWPRLLTIEQASAYVGLSRDSLLGYVADGTLPVTRPQRPNTDWAHRRTLANTETLRRQLFDRFDLDALVERWKRMG